MAQETLVQDRVVQPANSGESSLISSLLPVWPHSKPGPQVTTAPTGMKPVSYDRREQVCADDAVFIPFDPDTFEIDTAPTLRENYTQAAPTQTAQEGSQRRPQRL